MKRKIGFFFDAVKLGDFDFESFLKGDIGMSGTESQLFYLIDSLQQSYEVILFSNWNNKTYRKINTVTVTNLFEAAILAKKNNIELMIFTSREDEATKKGI